jgi:hypothetical protein
MTLDIVRAILGLLQKTRSSAAPRSVEKAAFERRRKHLGSRAFVFARF